ncbi:hypothetical protein NMY22_g19401 [Coprinellus aureogranulatus]|nr:hypothetical protein NMY22_g19401 [Coprinellus aureogranulatus]
MPAIHPNSNAKILLTGATGFVGQWVLRLLLDRGHTARVVVRSEAKAERVKKLFAEDVGKLEFVVIEDMSKEGAFDEGVVGVDAVVHVATPLPGEHEAPEGACLCYPKFQLDELAAPSRNLRVAQDSTVGVFKSALKKGDQVKRIIVTSSMVTIWSEVDSPRTFTEKDHNETAPRNWNEGKRDWGTVYENSKILAEKALAKWFEEHKNEVKFDYTLINPPMVFGPPVKPVASPSEIQSTTQFWFKGILEHATVPAYKDAVNGAWVDVRDLAEAHLVALEKPKELKGERIIVAAGSVVWREWLDALGAVAHTVLPRERADKLVAGLPKPLHKEDAEYKIILDTTREHENLGLTYHTKEETVRDTLAKVGLLEDGPSGFIRKNLISPVRRPTCEDRILTVKVAWRTTSTSDGHEVRCGHAEVGVQMEPIPKPPRLAMVFAPIKEENKAVLRPFTNPEEDVPDWRQRPYEEIWVTLYPFLLSRGYTLRPRYHPEWVPSWMGDPDPFAAFLSEDGIPSRENVVDAVREDGFKVFLKRIELETEELEIGIYLSSKPRVDDRRNHCAPALDIVLIPACETHVIIVMPLLYEHIHLPFRRVGELLEMGLQLSECLEFLHEHGIAHRDFCLYNIMIDPTRLLPKGFHPFEQHAPPEGRRPNRYYVIDFGMSEKYDTREGALSIGVLGQDRSVPEMSNTVPYNPFPMDVYQFGNMLSKIYKKYFSNPSTDKMKVLADRMTNTDPAQRPTAAEVAKEFNRLSQEMECFSLGERIWRSDFPYSFGKKLRVILGFSVFPP